MQPSDKAFDRVKSLLGKLDRSIDDARRRRLTESDEGQPQLPLHAPPTTPTHHDREPQAASTPEAPARESRPEPPVRSESKYGRARPIRDLSGPSQAAWQRA